MAPSYATERTSGWLLAASQPWRECRPGRGTPVDRQLNESRNNGRNEHEQAHQYERLALAYAIGHDPEGQAGEAVEPPGHHRQRHHPAEVLWFAFLHHERVVEHLEHATASAHAKHDGQRSGVAGRP